MELSERILKGYESIIGKVSLRPQIATLATQVKQSYGIQERHEK